MMFYYCPLLNYVINLEDSYCAVYTHNTLVIWNILYHCLSRLLHNSALTNANKPLKVSMLKATFKMYILHYVMEYVGNLCSPCLLHEQPKGEFVIARSAHEYYVCMPTALLGLCDNIDNSIIIAITIIAHCISIYIYLYIYNDM